MVCMKSRFTNDIACLNRLEPGIWLLGPGMAFGDTHNWWGKKLERTAPHNGVDLAYFRTPDGTQHNLGAGTLVPAPFDGLIARVIPDFLGMSVFLAHEIEFEGMRLISAIGHMAPHMLLHVGAYIKSGAPLGSISRPKNKTVPPHLHLTLARAPKDFPLSKLSWELLDQNKTILPIDPRPYF